MRYFFNSPTSGAYDFFQAWDLTNFNINASIEIDLFDRDGNIVQQKDTSIPMESIAGCITEMVDLRSGQKETVPKIRGKYHFDLLKAPYIVRFSISDPNRIESFRVAIIQ